MKKAQTPLQIPKNKFLKYTFLTGQSVLEYAVVIMVVVLAIVGMSVYIQRSVHANLKVLQDRANADAAN